MPTALTRLEPLVRALRFGGDDDLADLTARICWSCVVEPGDGDAGVLREYLGVECIFDLMAGHEEAVVQRMYAADPLEARSRTWSRSLERWRPRLNYEHVVPLVRAATKIGARYLVPSDPMWPRQLDDLGVHGAVGLWLRGRLAALHPDGRNLAIVGSRASTEYGNTATGELVVAATGIGLSIVSGGAYGIDAQAHRVALASEADTVAVLAGGVDRLYPAGNSDMFDRLLGGGGLVLSEVPCGLAPSKWRFLQRNRLIAALAPSTIVVEAGARSGALNTANHANALGRELGAVPGSITSATSVGCHRLIKAGTASMVCSGEDAIELWQLGLAGGQLFGSAEALAGIGDATTPLLEVADLAPRMSSEAVRVLDALRPRRGNGEAEIAALAGLTLADTRAGLAELELLGRADLGEAGWRRVS